MRIAHLCTKYWNYTETFVRQLDIGWAEAGHEVRVLTGRLMQRAESPIPHAIDVRQVDFLPRPALASRALRQAAERIDLPRPLFMVACGRRHAQRALSRSLMQSPPDVIYCDYGSVGILAMDAARELRVPLVVHFHGADASAGMRSRSYRRSVAELLETDVEIIVPSDHLRRLLALSCGIPRHISVIPCHPHLQQRFSAGKTAWPSVVCLGWLTGKKHPIASLHAFRLVLDAVPDARLTMIGGGPLQSEVAACVQRLGLSRSVDLRGPMEHDAAVDLLAASWVFAQHSVTDVNGDQEGLPVAIMESMALGVPPVSTIHAGIPEVVTHGRTGFLVREHDYESMAGHIIQLLQDDALRQRVGSAARMAIEDRGRRRSRVEQVTDVLERAVRRGTC